MGEDAEGAASSTAKLRAQLLGLTGGKVDIMIDDTTFKNTTQILREMANVWGELDDISRAGALELMGGKRQANILSSVITNFETVEDAIETSMDSSGSAFKENQKYLESIQGRIDIFNNALQTFWNNFISSDVIKFAVDSGTTLIELLDTGTGKVLALVAALKIAAKMKGFSFAGIGQSISTQIQAIAKAQNDVKILQGNGVDPAVDGIERYAKAVSTLTAKQQAAVLSSANLSKQQIIEAMRSNGVEEATIREATAHMSNAKARQQNAAASRVLSDEKAKEMAAILRAEAASVTGAAQSAKSAAAAYLEAHAHEQLTKEIIEERIARDLLDKEVGEQILRQMSGTSALMGGIGTFLKTNWVSILISLIPVAIGLISKLKGKHEELNKAAEDTLNKYSNAKKELSSTKKTIDAVSADFEKLSKGVDSSGNNISLSTKEYEKYNEIVNEIADMFPEMVTGYNEEGNAILKCKGNVEELTAAYEAAAQAARQEAIAGADDVFDAFKGNYDNVAVTGFGETGLKQQLDVANELVELIGNGDEAGVSSFFDINDGIQNDINNMLKAAGLTRKDFNGTIEDMQKAMPKLLSFVRSTTTGINTETNKVKSIMDAYLGDDFDYAKLDNETQNIINTLVSNLSADFINEFENADDLYNWIKLNIIDAFTDPELSKSVGSSIAQMIDLQYQFERGEMSVLQYKHKFLNVVDSINEANIDPQLKEQIEQLFDIDGEGSVGKGIDAMISHVEALFGDNLSDEIKANISKLNYSDLLAADGVIIPDKAFKSWQEFVDLIEKNKTIAFEIDFASEVEGLETLQTALSETTSATGMSVESVSNLMSRYQDLDNYNPSTLFEETAHGIHLNVDAARELENEYEELNKTKLDEKLDGLVDEYNNLTLEIQNTSDAFKRAELYSQRKNILDQINDTATLATRYEGLTSAYSKWQKAQSGSSERDMYEGIIAGKKEIDEEIARGWLDAGTREYIELLSGQDLSTAPFEKIIEVYKQLDKTIAGTKYDVYDFFTKDADDNATVDGIYNFFEAIIDVQKKGEEWVKKNEDGSYVFDFSVNGGEEAIAEALGISEELVQIILRAAADAGFDINLESAYSDLADFKDEITDVNDKLKELGVTEYTFNINSTNLDDLNVQIEEAEKALDTFRNKDGVVNVKAEGAKETQTLLATLIYQKQILDDAAVLRVDTANADAGIETVVKKLQNFKAAYNELEVKLAIGEDTTEAETNLRNAILNLQMESPSIRAKLGIDLNKSKEEINTAINNISADKLLELGIDASKIETYKESEHATDGTVVWDNNIDAVTAWMEEPHKVEGKVIWENDTSKVKTLFTASGLIGGGFVNGTAHMRGTAFANGSFGAKKSETSLVGELGPEMRVRGDQWTLLGEHGAEFADVRKGDIIFNHKQTAELLANGYVAGRGKAYAAGTGALLAAQKEYSLAMAARKKAEKNNKGSWADIQNLKSAIAREQKANENYIKAKNAYYGTSGTTVYKNYGASENKSHLDVYGSTGGGISKAQSKTLRQAGTAAGAGSGKDDSKQLIDFIEIKLEEIEHEISLATAKVTNFVDDTSAENLKQAQYDKLVAEEQKKKQTYTDASAYYAKKADELLNKVDAKYRDKAQNGAIDIKEFVGDKNSKQAEAIQEYRDMAAKADEAKVAELESIARIEEIRLEQFNDLADDYDNLVSIIESESNLLNVQMDLLEAQGERLSSKYYESLIENTNDTISTLEDKRNRMQKDLKDAVSDGDIQKGSDAWYEMVNAISEVDEEIVQCRIDVEEFQNAINDLKWANLDKLVSRLDSIGSELSHVFDRLSDDDDDVVNDNGTWNQKGIAALGVAAQQMELAQAKAKQYSDAINDLKADYDKGLYSQDEFNEKLAELTENQWDAIESYEDAKDAIVDLNKTRIEAVKKGIEEEIDAYKELIDTKKEELDANKDLYDFEKNVAKQQKDIATIERKIAALSGDTSISATAQRKQLEAELAEAKAELEDTYYDRSIENQKNALDQEAEVFEESKKTEMENLDKWLEDENAVLQESIDTVKNNADIVLQEVNSIAEKYGITLSSALVSPWENGKNAIDSYKDKFVELGSAFSKAVDKIVEEQNQIQEDADDKAEKIISETKSKTKKNKGGGSKPVVNEGPVVDPNVESDPPKENKTPSKGDAVTVSTTATNFSSKSGNKSMASFVKGGSYTVMQTSGDQVLIGKGGVATGWVDKKDLDGYANGTLGVKKDDWAWIDEVGEELVLHAGSDGKLAYLTKGTSVIPSDITSKLMGLALDPTQTLENSRPVINAPNITNNEINISMDVAEVVHIDTVTNDTMPNLTKAIDKQLDKYMKDLNNQIRKYTR